MAAALARLARPHWGMLAVSLAMTALVAVASAGYSKLIQMVMTAFQAGEPSVLWWGPLGVIALSGASAVGQFCKEVTGNRVTNRMETELARPCSPAWSAPTSRGCRPRRRPGSPRASPPTSG